MKVHQLYCLNTSQVVHRQNDVLEFNHVLMNQLSAVDVFDSQEILEAPVFDLLESDRAWCAIVQMAEASFIEPNEQTTNDCLEPVQPSPSQSESARDKSPQPVLEAPANLDILQPTIDKSNSIHSDDRGLEQRPQRHMEGLRLREPKTILSLSAQSRVLKRSRKKKHRAVHFNDNEDVVHVNIPQVEPKDTSEETRNANVPTPRSYRLIVDKREPFKLIFEPVYE